MLIEENHDGGENSKGNMVLFRKNVKSVVDYMSTIYGVDMSTDGKDTRGRSNGMTQIWPKPFYVGADLEAASETDCNLEKG